MQTLYDLIGVSPDADTATIAAQIDHLEQTVEPKSERAKELDFAHLRSVLLDPEEREQYDGMMANYQANATSLMSEASWQYISDSVVEPPPTPDPDLELDREAGANPTAGETQQPPAFPNLRQWVRTYMGHYGAVKWVLMHAAFYWLVITLNGADFFQQYTAPTLLLAMLMVTLSFFQTYHAIESLVRHGISRLVPLLAGFGWLFWETFAAYHLHLDLPLLRPADRVVLFVVVYPALCFLLLMSAYGLVVHGATKPAIE